VGSATVALYVKGLLFDALFQQSIQPIEKFSQRVFHTVYTNSHLPYCLSAYILHAEVR
jgi:cholesterol 7-dehydrogenase